MKTTDYTKQLCVYPYIHTCSVCAYCIFQFRSVTLNLELKYIVNPISFFKTK